MENPRRGLQIRHPRFESGRGLSLVFASSSPLFLGNSKVCRISAVSSLGRTDLHAIAPFRVPTAVSTAGAFPAVPVAARGIFSPIMSTMPPTASEC